MTTLPAPPARPFTAALVTALSLGTALRLAQYLAHPSLFVDEAMLALNLGARSYGGLLHRLDYGQTAPIPFLWAERLAVTLGGMNEYALRAVPLLAGLALPFAFWRLARRLGDARETLLAVSLIAVSPLLIRFSAMAKPYGLDALLTVWLLHLALDVRAAPDSRRAWWWLIGAGGAAIWLSTPAVFVVGGIWAALAFTPAVRQALAAPRWLAAAALVWSALFAAQYVAIYRGVATSGYMHQYWADSFLTPAAPDLPWRAWLALRYVLLNVLVGSRPQVWGVVLFLALTASGVWAVWRRHGAWAVWLVLGPIAAAVAASAVERYPVAPRMLVYAAPLMILLLVAGLSWIAEEVRRPFGPWAFALGGAAWVALPLLQNLFRPYRPDAVRPLVREVQQALDSAPIYVHAGALPAWVLYTTDWARPDTARLRWMAEIGSPGGPAFHNALGRGRPVSHEGWDLVRQYRGRAEVIGIPPGQQFRELTRWTQEAPDVGWAANEVARMRAAGSREVWVLCANFHTRQTRHLYYALRRLGGAKVYEREAQGAWLFRYRFPPSASGAR